jgi:ELWxxDGT repeat protein
MLENIKKIRTFIPLSLVLLIGLIGLIGIIGLATAAGAQPAHLVRNLYPDDGYAGRAPSYPLTYQFLNVGAKAFFLAYNRVGVTDGTATGTRILYEDAGFCSRDRTQLLGSTSNLIFWVSCAGDAEAVLWRSDGTTAGTFPLTTPSALSLSFQSPFPGDPPGDPDYAVAGGFLYFEGCPPERLCTLFRTDGTLQGTRAVKEEEPLRGMAGVGNRLFFVASNEDFRGVLASTDGTAAGTVHLRSFGHGSGPRRLTAAGGKLFFLAGDDDEEELWVSDGTAAGTRAVSHFAPSDPFEDTNWLKAIGNRVYFLADDVEHGVELWRSDGTEAGTVRITEIGYHAPFDRSMRPSHVEEATNGRVVFLATDDLESYKVWATSGTPGSTTLLTDVCPGDCRDSNGFNSLGDLVRSPGGRVVFRREGATAEAWSTDGTLTGTVRLSDNVSSRPVLLRDGVFFFGGGHLWRSDGTPAGTRVFGDLPSQVSASFRIRDMGMAGGKVVFPADHRNYGTDLWASAGRPGTTELLADFDHESGKGSSPGWLMELNGQLLFQATTPDTASSFSNGITTLWRSGGSAETTVPLSGALPQACGSPPPLNPFRDGGRVFFSWPGDFCRTTLWVTDGTSGGTRALVIEPSEKAFFQGQLFFLSASPDSPGRSALFRNDVTPGTTTRVFDLPAEARNVFGFTAAGSGLYFVAYDAESVQQVWRSDGTLAGTRQLTSFSDDENIDISPRFFAAGGFVFFTAGIFRTNILWRTDGTPAGTIALTNPSFSDDPPTDFMVFQGDLFFFQLITNQGEEALFRSDGTPAGTVRLYTFPNFEFQSSEHHPVVYGDRLFFTADDGVHGTELWQTDGTATGTVLVRDIFPGEPSSRPQGLTTAGGQLFFQANDGVHGAEPWQSDGTAAGTRIVQDLNPGFARSLPEGFTPVGGQLFFSADDGVTGRELWVLPLGPTGPCQPSATALCLSGGRYRVEAQLKTSSGSTDAAHAVALSPDTGYFWFFDAANVEAIVKVLDGRGSNGHQWVFYGALSNVEYTLTVTDTQTGLARRYFNPQGSFASVGDTHAFGPLGAAEVKRLAAGTDGTGGAPLLVSERLDAAAATGTCVPAPRRLCLNGGRFAVEAKWKLPDRAGAGMAVGITSDTGYFWFFDAANVEVVVKVLDATAGNGHFWVFYGALSNVEYELAVTDTVTGKVKTYKNPRGRFASVGDTAAF